MTVRRLLVPTCLVLFTSLCASAFPSGGDSGPRSTDYHRSIEWKSDEGEVARGLFFFHSESAGMARRVLVADPHGRRLVLTKTLLPRVGMEHEVLVDEETGWRIELTKHLPYRAPTFRDYLRMMLADDRPPVSDGSPMSFTLTTSSEFSFSSPVPIGSQPSVEHRDFAQRLSNADGSVGSVEALRVPPSLAPAIRFLDGAFETDISDSRAIVDILAAILDPAPTGGSSTWHQIDGPTIPGSTLGDGELIDFASTFTSVNPVEPLPEDHLEKLARQQSR